MHIRTHTYIYIRIYARLRSLNLPAYILYDIFMSCIYVCIRRQYVYVCIRRRIYTYVYVCIRRQLSSVYRTMPLPLSEVCDSHHELAVALPSSVAAETEKRETEKGMETGREKERERERERESFMYEENNRLISCKASQIHILANA